MVRSANSESAGVNHDRRSGPDRRLSVRYPVDSVEVQLAWSAVATRDSTQSAAAGQPRADRWPAGRREGEGHAVPTSLVRHPARVVDLSQLGLSLLADHPPPADRKLWIGILENSALSWSEVTLRWLSCPAPGVYLLRLSFQETCPYELFKAAVLRPGTSPDAPGSKSSNASPEG